jgi:hypothetical protein
MAVLVDALHQHSTLEELDLCGNHCRAGALQSLSKYVSRDDCRLHTLKVGDQFYKQWHVTPGNDGTSSSTSTSIGTLATKEHLHRFPIEELLPGLGNNHSLRHLDLARNQLDNIDAILFILRNCPQIRVLDLLGNRISAFRAYASSSGSRRFLSRHTGSGTDTDTGSGSGSGSGSGTGSRPTSSRLRHLELSYNQHLSPSSPLAEREETAKWFCHLLESHPELESFAKSMPPCIWNPSTSSTNANTMMFCILARGLSWVSAIMFLNSVCTRSLVYS